MNDKLVNMDEVNLGVLVKKSQDDDGYTENAYDADFERCPICESPTISYGDADPDGIFIYRTHSCLDCLTEWEERYDLVKVTIKPGP